MSQLSTQAKQPQLWRTLRFWMGFGASAMIIVLVWFFALANTPDRNLFFLREIPSPLSQEALRKYVFDTKLWPEWYHSVSEVQILSEDGQKSIGVMPERTIVHVGDKLRIHIDSGKGAWKVYDIIVQVTQIETDRLLRMRVLSDSKDRILKQFENLEWEVEIAELPPALSAAANEALKRGRAPNQSIVRGRAFARTRTWRARLFGSIAERILMSQVYYPNLLALAEKGTGAVKAEAPFLPK